MADIEKLLTGLGTLAGLAEAELGNQSAVVGTMVFTDALGAVPKDVIPTIEQWTGAAFMIVDGIVEILPDSTEKEKVVKLLEDCKQLILDGEHGKAVAAFFEALKVIKDIKALAKK